MKKRKGMPVTPESIEKVFDALDAALSNNGLSLPTNESEVRNSESFFNSEEIELPDILKDPMATLERGRKLLKEGLVIPAHIETQKETVFALAQAARNGKEISPDLLEIMHKDRAHAESGDRDA